VIVGVYGDDVTGSVDALLQYRRAGLRGALVTSPSRVGAVADRTDLPVVVVAGTARSLPTAAMAAEVVPALEALKGARLVQYKACSTADSSPAVGSLGTVIELAREAYGSQPVPLLFAQPDFGRYTVFGHHFARDGDRVWRLDRQPTMSRHPVTPMGESDLAVHLGRQTRLPIASVPWTAYGNLDDRLRDPAAAAYVLDALDDDHLDAVGAAVLGLPARPTFALGSGGLSRAVGGVLARRLGASAPPLADTAASAPGPLLAVSGSCSGRTWDQVRAALDAGWVGVALGPEAVGQATAAYAAGRDVVLFSAQGGAVGTPVDVSGDLAAAVRACGSVRPVPRLLVCGGDTSGRVLQHLGALSLEIVAAPWGNAPLLRVAGGEIDGTEVVVKGGQVGGVDLFEQVRRGR